MNKGCALGNLASKSLADRTRLLDGAQRLGMTIVRSDVSWVDGMLPDWAKYDNLLDDLARRNLQYIACLHTNVAGGGSYSIPADPVAHADTVIEIVTRYGDRQTGAGRSLIAGWDDWNEYNTRTGNAGGAMTPTDMALAAEAVSAGVRFAELSLDRRQVIYGPSVGGLDLPALQAIYDADPRFFEHIDVLTMHSYLSGGTDSAHNIDTLTHIRDWLASVGQASIPIAFTEGGIAGIRKTPRPPNVLSLAGQRDLLVSAWGKAAAAGVDLWCYYNPVSLISTLPTYDGTGYDYAYWYACLPLMNYDGTLKPAGTSFISL